MGYSKKAGTWVPVDRTDGEVSVSELQKKLAKDQTEWATWATSTWDKPVTLSASQIAVLDGKNSVAKDGTYNSIGQPVKIESGPSPRGFSEGTVKGDD